MAKGVCRLMNYCVWIFSISSLISDTNQSDFIGTTPFINSINILNETISDYNNTIHNKYILELNGTNLKSGIDIWPIIRGDKRGVLCDKMHQNFFKYSFNELSFDDNHNIAKYDLDIELQHRDSFDTPLIKVYFCVGNVRQSNNVIFKYDSTIKSDFMTMVHQGYNISIIFRTNNNHFLSVHNQDNIHSISHTKREQRSINDLDTPTLRAERPQQEDNHDTSFMPIVIRSQDLADEDREHNLNRAHLTGFRIEKTKKEPELGEDGVPTVLTNIPTTIRIFGTGITEKTILIITKENYASGTTCHHPITDQFNIEKNTIHSVKSVGNGNQKNALVIINIPVSSEKKNLYFCTKELAPENATLEEKEKYNNAPFKHQGSDLWLIIRSHDKLLPLWASITIILVCLSFSALFSGLNLGLMSLDRTELKILLNTGTPKEREYAAKIQPVRDQGNFLLCSILLGNVFVNSIFTILLDDLTSGIVAVVFSTITIVLFGEITPQAVCSRHGLAVGAKTIIITKIVMGFTAPLSYPISKILDLVLGEEIGNVYNRERLKELVKVTTDTNDLDKDEVNIISGALELRKKTVSDVMTRIEDVFMLDYESILNFETVSEIMKSGFSRIPVYEGNRTNIVTMLYIKDLAFVDPDDNTPLKTLSQFYQNPCNFVFEDVTLDVMFKQFKEGHKGHMAFVHRVNNEGEGDPFYETVGLVTLEDVIEELIQAEIMDETDVFTDNRSKRRRNEHRKQDFTIFAERREHQRIRISPQLTLATFQYLSTSIDLFKPDTISETILRRMLKQDIIVHIKKKDKHDPLAIIYQQGKPADYFVLILEGRVEVTVGRENLIFESGPFTYFGKQALMQNIGGVAESPVQPTNMGSIQSVNMETLLRHTFVPDYSVRATTEVLYIKIKRSLYMAAKRATLMERSQKDNTLSTTGGDQFDDEVEKLLHSLEEDGLSVDRSSPIHSEINENTQNTKTEINEYIKETNRKPSVTQLQLSPSMKDTISPSFNTFSSQQHSDNINGAIKKHSLPTTINLYNTDRDHTSEKEEETALLSTQNTKS